MNSHPTAILAAMMFLLASPIAGADIATLCADRAAIERVYHEHRTGTKVPFEQAMPAALLESIVRMHLKKEALLARTYGVQITPALLSAEVRRIDTTTRAPEMLAEIKTALGSDPEKFAHTFAKPFLVERELRQRFDNDDALHAPQRRVCEDMRVALLAVTEGGFQARLTLLKTCPGSEMRHDVTWKLTPRPADAAVEPPVTAAVPTEIKARSGAYTNEATAQMAQVLSSPETTCGNREDQAFFFEDLPADLQNVLQAQLRQPGDVSAVIESTGAFQIYLARERTPTSLTAAVLTLPKRSLEAWLAQQSEP